MSKSSVFVVLSVSLFISAIALVALSYGATVNSEATDNILQVIADNQLIAGLAAAAIGSLLTALIVFIIEDNRDKRKSAVNVLEEFTSFNFLETRNKAGLVFKQHLHEPIKGLDDLYFALQNDNWRYVSHIEHFFKKVDNLIALNELDRSYIRTFLTGEFTHWYNSYFFPALLADLARKHYIEANENNIKPANLLTFNSPQETAAQKGQPSTQLPLRNVDYASAFGANRSEAQTQRNMQEVIEIIKHAEALVNSGIIDSSVFFRTKSWNERGAFEKDNFLSFYGGTSLPFPNLRKLSR